MNAALEQLVTETWPPQTWSEDGVVVAVSGGADSVALLLALYALRPSGQGQLHVAHYNHALRGAEANADERFVIDLAGRLGLDCRVERASLAEFDDHGGGGLEAAARDARYDFLRRTAEQLGARYVATAHTADDQAETILHRIVRGTGLAGLAGIGRLRTLGPAVTAIRPLLGARRSDVLAYLAERGQPFRDDSSNLDLRFTRNRLRRELLPSLAAQYNPTVVDALLRLGVLAGEAQAVLDGLVERLLDIAVVEESAGVRIDAGRLAGEPRYLVRELLIRVWRRRGWPLQAMGFAQWEQLAEFFLESLAGNPPQQTLPGQIIVRAAGGQVWLERQSPDAY